MKRIQRDKSSPLKKYFFLRTRLITPHKKGRLMDQPPPGGWQQINSLPDPSGFEPLFQTVRFGVQKGQLPIHSGTIELIQRILPRQI
jgi:hypothetical protein